MLIRKCSILHSWPVKRGKDREVHSENRTVKEQGIVLRSLLRSGRGVLTFCNRYGIKLLFTESFDERAVSALFLSSVPETRFFFSENNTRDEVRTRSKRVIRAVYTGAITRRSCSDNRRDAGEVHLLQGRREAYTTLCSTQGSREGIAPLHLSSASALRL